MSLFGGRKKEDLSDGPSEPTTAGVGGVLPAAPPAAAPAWSPSEERGTKPGPARAAGGEVMANIGKSIVIKGDLTGEEDRVIEGKVEGKVLLPNHRLTIGQGGYVQAEVHAKSVEVICRVAGNVSAGERLEVQASGIVDGDVRAPRLSVQEGAVLNGSIQMSAAKEPAKAHAKEHAKEPAPRPVPLPQAAVAAGGEARRLV